MLNYKYMTFESEWRSLVFGAGDDLKHCSQGEADTIQYFSHMNAPYHGAVGKIRKLTYSSRCYSEGERK